MIIWLASYPKSGNTWIRSLLTSYFYSNDGVFNFNLLNKIEQFSSKNVPIQLNDKSSYQTKISKNWIPAQKIINDDKKVHLLKTHNAICAINGNNFTDKFNTIGAIYIVRDPRNLVTSLANHYEFNLEESFNFISNKRKIIFLKNDNLKSKSKDEPEDFNFLGDWASHYKSWKNINFCEIKIVKYEDILKNPRENFISILNFLLKFMKFDIDQKKILNALESTKFSNLSKMEEENDFDESVISSKAKKKIKFFNLGKKNNWEKLLNSKMSEKIRMVFNKEMKELEYI